MTCPNCNLPIEGHKPCGSFAQARNTQLHRPKCLTCHKPLSPVTSLPRWNDEAIELHREAYAKWQAQREDDIANGRFGHLGEAHFCGQQCAAFYGRAAAKIAQQVERIRTANDQMVSLWNWVSTQRAKNAPKGKS